MKKFICAAFYAMLLFSGRLVAQDVIYPSTGDPVLCKIVSIEGNKIKYSIPKNPGPAYIMDASDALMAFNGNGNVVTFPTNNDADGARFMSAPANKKKDILVTVDNEVIECQSLSVGKKDVKFKKEEGKKAKEEKLDRENVAVILYKNGKHEFGVNPMQAVVPLKMAKIKIDQMTGVSATTLTTNVATEKPVEKGTEMGNTPEPDDVIAFPGGPAEFEQFRQKAIGKVEEFGGYIAAIVNPKTPSDQANKNIELAFTLFVNEDVRVEVSNVNTGSKNKYKIKDYLRRLKLKGADYQEVDVSYADIGYATDFTKGPDGNYYGVVSFVQTFKGLIDGKVAYGDVTQRNVTVILKLMEKQMEGQGKKIWDVFLADVGIIETRKL